MSLHPSEIIRKLFAGVGSPYQSQRQRLDRIKRNCMNYKDPHVCYLVMELGAQPYVSWRHNTGNHFGRAHQQLTYEGYLGLVHPAWNVLYYLYGEIAYGISVRNPEKLQEDNITFTLKVPLLGADGNYYWYDQIVIPGEVDHKGQMCSHLNYYRRLDRYERLLPSAPTIHIGGRIDEQLGKIFHVGFKKIVDPFLASLFPPKQAAFLQKYRALTEVRDGGKPAREAGAKALGFSTPDAYDRAQQRIKNRLDSHLMGLRANTAHAFAGILNDFLPENRG